MALIVESNDVQRAWVSQRWESTFIGLIRHNTESVPLQEKVVTQEEKNIVVQKTEKERERSKITLKISVNLRNEEILKNDF